MWAIIEDDNLEVSPEEDGGRFPSEAGAHLDFDDLVSTEMCLSYFSVHHREARKQLQGSWAIPRYDFCQGGCVRSLLAFFGASQPLTDVKDYFGEHTAWYFVWMGFYTRALMLPSAVGVGVFVVAN